MEREERKEEGIVIVFLEFYLQIVLILLKHIKH